MINVYLTIADTEPDDAQVVSLVHECRQSRHQAGICAITIAFDQNDVRFERTHLRQRQIGIRFHREQFDPGAAQKDIYGLADELVHTNEKDTRWIHKSPISQNVKRKSLSPFCFTFYVLSDSAPCCRR